MKSTTSGSGGGTTSTVTDGLTIEAIVGLFSPTESGQDGGGHTLDNLGLIPVTSGLQLQNDDQEGSSTKYIMPTVK